MTSVIQPATLDDLPALAGLFDQYRQFYGEPPDLSLAKQFIGERLQQQDSTLLAVKVWGEELAGFCQLYPSFSSIQCRRTLILNDLFVSPGHRSAGVGWQLVEAAIQCAKASGANCIQLETALANTAAQRLYERLGFARATGFLNYTLSLGSHSQEA